MSETIYCQAHLNGDSQQIEVSEIIEAFSSYVVKSDEFGFDVVYDEMNRSCVFIDTLDKTCSDFSISRPCGDQRLFESIYKCLSLGKLLSDPENKALIDDNTQQRVNSNSKSFWSKLMDTFKR